MTKTKKQHEEAIIKAIEDATKDGIEVVVATDPEGNSYCSINPDMSLYDNTLPKVIALGVWREHIDEEELFEPMSEEDLKRAEEILRKEEEGPTPRGL